MQFINYFNFLDKSCDNDYLIYFGNQRGATEEQVDLFQKKEKCLYCFLLRNCFFKFLKGDY